MCMTLKTDYSQLWSQEKVSRVPLQSLHEGSFQIMLRVPLNKT